MPIKIEQEITNWNGESVDDAIQRLTRELESRPDRPEISQVASPEEGAGEK